MNESDDFALALQLQEQFYDQSAGDQYAKITDFEGADSDTSKTGQSSQLSQTQDLPESLVDDRWELLDPNPDVRALFIQFNHQYFWGKLECVEVRWSPRMTLCAGVCCYEGQGGLCSVRLSQPLLKLRPRKDLIETLLHEMIHAYLFVTQNNKDHDGHGPEFLKHMHRLNKETGAGISVYHNFHDEVDSYRQHWWRCDGPCRSRRPYFGYVKRAMNRAPSARDPWWGEHSRSCGGTYHKIKEPEGYGQKKNAKKSKEDKKQIDKPDGNRDIRDIFNKQDKKTDDRIKSNENDSNNQPSTSGIGHQAKPQLDRPNNSSSVRTIGSYNSDNETGTSGTGHQSQQERTNSASTVRTIGSYNSDDDSTDDARNSDSQHAVSKPHTFSGQGRTLGGQSSGVSSGPIVRKLPGIGIIRSERPRVPSETASERPRVPSAIGSDRPRVPSETVLDHHSMLTGTADRFESVKVAEKSDRSADYCIINEESSCKNSITLNGSAENPLSGCKENGSANNGNANCKRPEFFIDQSSDSETDLLLQEIIQKKKKHKVKKRVSIRELFSGKEKSPEGSHVKVVGFTSVSNRSGKNSAAGRNRQRLLAERNRERLLAGGGGDNTSAARNRERLLVGRGGENQTAKRDESLAASRNKRPMEVSSSESDSDLDEHASISALLKKRKLNSTSSDTNPVVTDSQVWPSYLHGNRDVFDGSDNTRSTESLGNRNMVDVSDNTRTSDSHGNRNIVDVSNNTRASDSHGNRDMVDVFDNTRSSDSHGNRGMADVSDHIEPMVDCPVCSKSVKASAINEHLDTCLQ